MKTLRARIKRVVISPEAFFHILETDTSWQVTQGIPRGSTLRGLTMDPLTMNWNLFVEHPEFPEVDLEREVSPQLKLLFKKF